MHTLVLQRHAKSDYPPGVPDHDRPLAARGRRDAPVAGAWLAEHGPALDLALVSTAVRARQTWDLIAPAIPTVATSLDGRIYEASVGTLLRVISEISEDVDSAIVVGHNPGLEDLAGYLATSGSVRDRSRMSEKYPTSALAVLTSQHPWAQFGDAELVAFEVPRG